MLRPPPRSPLFPYTTLFRSVQPEMRAGDRRVDVGVVEHNVRTLAAQLERDPLQRGRGVAHRSEEHTSELQSQSNLVCRLLLEKKEISRLRPASRSGRAGSAC